MTKYIFLALSFLCIFAGMSCKKNPVAPPTYPLQLSVQDVTCTEAYLKLSLSANETQRTIVLKRSDSAIATITLARTDSSFVDQGLLPKKSYTYTLTAGTLSASAQATTLDTSSHNWMFQTFTFNGDVGSCVLNDAAIINDTLAYAVGEIYLKDSTGQFDPLPYNLARWNGVSWQLTKVTVQTTYGLVTAPFYGICAFSSSDIWILSGLPIHGDGKNWTQYDLYRMGVLSQSDGYLTKAWGKDSSDIYFVGTTGTIVHYNGSSWTKIGSGTTTDIQDIWGGTDPTTGTTYALATVSTVYYGGVSELLRIRGTQLDTLSTNGLSWSIRGVWFDSKDYYIVGDEVYYKRSLQDNMWQILRVAPTNQYGYVEAIRANGRNDIVVAGDFGTFLHFNGVSWHNFTQEINLPSTVFYSVAIKGDIAIAVGSNGDKAIAVIGKR